MDRRHFLRSAAAALAAPALARFAQAESPPHTNVLWILTDDLGFGDLSCTGRSGYSTPHIDSLARDGVFLERAYVYPVCTASRAAMLTGHSPQRYGLESVLLPGYAAGLPRDSINAAREFRAAGYATSLIGKWHLGDTPASHPNAQGFDEFHGFLWGETGYYTHTKLVQGEDRLDFQRNGTPEDTPGYTTDIYAARAIGLMRLWRSRPFFMVLSFNAPHYYLDAPVEHQNLHSGTSADRVYAGAMRSLDENIGRVLAGLDALGLRRNTLVVFTSDNGAPAGAGSNRPLTGLKNTLMEGGIRSPSIVRLPGTLPAGTRSRALFSPCDLLPTSLALAGIPTGTRFEGRNRRECLLDPSLLHDDSFCMRYTFSGRESRAALRGRWKLHLDAEADATRLTDLDADPSESVNLLESHTDVASGLRADWNAWSSAFSPNLGIWS